MSGETVPGTTLVTRPGRYGTPAVMVYWVERTTQKTPDGKPLYAAGSKFIEGPSLQICLSEARKQKDQLFLNPRMMGVTIMKCIEETRRESATEVVLDRDFEMTRRRMKNGHGD